MLSFSIRLTDMDRISSSERKVNSTLSSDEPTGCAIFMLGKRTENQPEPSNPALQSPPSWRKNCCGIVDSLGGCEVETRVANKQPALESQLSDQ